MKKDKVGVWIIGVLGSISATVITGTLAIRKGLASAIGMVSDMGEFSRLPLIELDQLVFGGCDVRKGSLLKSADSVFRQSRAVSPEIFQGVTQDLIAIEENIRAGTARNCGEAIIKLADCKPECDTSLLEDIEQIRTHLKNFKADNELSEVIVVNLASTEPPLPLEDHHYQFDQFKSRLEANDVHSVRASSIYSAAAIYEGCPYINFTPSNAALVPALIELAEQRKVPVMGNDGKTGETLVKSALAPMFSCRNLRVLSWEGFNILGNMDGKILDHPSNRLAKVRSKDGVLPKILGYAPHSKVSIDYVPSLDDQKTAWDFIHFEGFLGARMSLQFVWQGYDSLLAAPLILDLVRFAEFAKRNGEGGLMPHLGSFFKSPLGVQEQRLGQQFQMLSNYVQGHLKTSRSVRLVG